MSGVAAILRQEGYLAGAMSCVVLTGPGGEDNKHGSTARCLFVLRVRDMR